MPDFQLETTSAQDLQFLAPEPRLVILKNLKAFRGSCLVRQEMTAAGKTAAGKSSKQEIIDLPIEFTEMSGMVAFTLFRLH